MCAARNDRPESQAFGAPNRYCAVSEKDDFPPLALRRGMICIKTGARQVILDELVDGANYWTSAERPRAYTPHYPNVDVYECPICHARIAKEA